MKRSAGMSGAFDWAISAFVFAGLPTTRIFTSSAAPAFSASPCGLKIAPLASSRSARSMPFERGRAPISSATLTPSNAFFGSSWMSIDSSSGNAQSSSSIAVPSAALTASRDLEQRQLDLLVGAQHLPGGDAEQDRVADLAGRAGYDYSCHLRSHLLGRLDQGI